MPTATIPAAVAAWIRTTVLPAGYLDSVGDPAVCPCQYGPSGHCTGNNHEQCPRTTGWHRHGQPDPETHITDRRGMVAVAKGVSSAVWRTGRACRWLCPCTCHTTVTPLFDAPPRQTPRQSTAGCLRIASTDRLRSLNTPPPTLFDLAH